MTHAAAQMEAARAMLRALKAAENWLTDTNPARWVVKDAIEQAKAAGITTED